jgi:hypothetical protein
VIRSLVCNTVSEYQVQFKVTPNRILFGITLSLAFGLQMLGKVNSHAWAATTGILVGIALVPLAFATAFTAKPISSAAFRDFPKLLFQLAMWAVIWLVVFKIFDVFHLWRHPSR